MHIKNQFLRWFVYYFNICSVPLLPVCFRFGHRGQGRLLFTWNLFSIATSLYFIFALMTPQALLAIRRRGDALFGNSSQKPLFTLFFRLGVTFALPMGFFSSYLYFSKLCLAPKSSSRSTAYLFSLLDRPNVTIPRRVFLSCWQLTILFSSSRTTLLLKCSSHCNFSWRMCPRLLVPTLPFTA